MDAPDLIIPVRMDSSKAVTGLHQIGQAGRQAGDDVNQGMGHAQGGIKGAMEEMGDFLKAQVGLAAVKNLAANIGGEFNRIAEHIGQASKDFQAFRASLQGAAALSGQPNTTKFAMEEIAKAQAANVTPQEGADFRKAFLAKASLYAGEGPEAKLSTKDADEYQASLMEYAKLKGVSQQEMAGFGGGLLAQAKGPQTAAGMKAQAGRVFATLEASSADVSHLLPGMTRAMAAGFQAEEAAPTLAMMPEIAPEEESTYMLRAVSALRETTQKGGGEKLGLKKGMSPYAMLTTAVQKIKERQAKGEDLDDLITEATHGEEVSGRALKGMVGQGPEGFAKWRRLVEATPDDAMARTIAEGRDTEPGRQYRADAREAAEKARLGARADSLTRRRQEADTDLMASGAKERVDWKQLYFQAIPGADTMDGRQQSIQAIGRARQELHERMRPSDLGASINRGTADELLRELIKRIDEQNQMMRDDAKRKDGGPLPAPMPRPAGR